MPIPRFGGVGMAWAFFGAVWELLAWHRYWESRARVGKEIPAFAGMTTFCMSFLSVHGKKSTRSEKAIDFMLVASVEI
jgi:hypothetical protein